MWNHKNSLWLSKIFTLLGGAAVAFLLFTGPLQINWLFTFSTSAHENNFWLFVATLYSGGVLALVLLWQLYALLRNIGREEVFTAANVRLLRNISWLCLGGAAIALASGLYYMPWAIAGVAAAFVGLIVRVVKNVIAEAIALKEENDLTV